MNKLVVTLTAGVFALSLLAIHAPASPEEHGRPSRLIVNDTILHLTQGVPSNVEQHGAADTEETRHPIGSNDGAASIGHTVTFHQMLSRGRDTGGVGYLPTWNRRGGDTVMAVRFPPTLNRNGVGAGSIDGLRAASKAPLGV